MPPRIPARATAWGACFGSVAGAAVAVRSILANAYVTAGLGRLAAFELLDGATLGALAGGAACLAVALAYGAFRQWGRSPERALGAAIAWPICLVPYLHYGFVLNRYTLNDFWRSTTSVLGVPVPSALTSATPLLANGLLTLSLIVAALVLGRLLALAFRALSNTALAGVPGRLARPAAFWFAGLVVALGAGHVWAGMDRRQSGPNVLLISVDTLRADHLGCYGYSRNTSPAIDALARDGVRFANAVSQAPWTLPSHVTMMTSLYPTVHGVVKNDQRLAERETTLAEILRNDGYATGAFVDGGYLRTLFGFDQGFQVFEEKTTLADALRGRRGWGIARIRRKASAWMTGRSGSRFFCFLHCYDVHAPYAPPEPYDAMFLDERNPSRFEATTENLNRFLRAARAGGNATLPPPSADDIERLRALYDGGIRYVDDELGRLFAEMKERGVYDETLIILTSDHGEELYEHRTFMHFELYYTIAQVPLIVKPPAGASWAFGATGSVVDRPVELVDLVPTVLDALGVESDLEMSGRSLISLMSGAAGSPDEDEPAVFTESEYDGRLRALTTPDYRLIRRLGEDRYEMYRRSDDPLEQTDVRSESPEEFEALRERLARWMVRQESLRDRRGGPSAETAEIDEGTLDQLRGLGYVD